MPKKNREVFFATCAPGLEEALHQETRALRFARVERQVGGVYFEGNRSTAWSANLHLRTAIRVLWRLARFDCKNESALYEGVHEIEWEKFLGSSGTVAVSAQTQESQLDHSMFIAQKTKDAIVDRFRSRFGERPSIDREAPDLAVHVHISRDRATISIDTSGESLHKRGWRKVQGRAPLAETLAAAILIYSSWDHRSPLVDPFCGSATLLIEAALMASGTPAGGFRSFGFERFPDHDAKSWAALRGAALENCRLPGKLQLLGYDKDAAAIEGARRNIESAGLSDRITLEVKDVLQVDWRSGWNAWIVTNPPYGERLADADRLLSLYRDLGRSLREHCTGYHLALMSGDKRLRQQLKLSGLEIRPLKNGALECDLVTTRLGS